MSKSCPQCSAHDSRDCLCIDLAAIDSPTPPGTGLGDEVLDKLLDDFAASRGLCWYDEEAKDRAAIHAHLSAAVQEAVSKYQWLCKNVDRVSTIFGDERAWFFTQTGDRPYPNLDALVVAEMAREEYVNVKDFGAVGDGVTDDTAAFQRAFDAAESRSHHPQEPT